MYLKEIKFFAWSFCLGVALITYANANFVTRPMFNLIFDEIRIIRSDIKSLKLYLLENND